MKKLLLGVILVFGLTGCGQVDRVVAKYTGYSLICVEETGVQYVQFTSGAAVLLDKDGKPVKC